MYQTLNDPHNVIQEGIKTAGIGKKGSKDLSDEQIQAICEAIRDKTYAPESFGAFLGALVMKGISHQEKEIESAIGHPVLSRPEILIEQFAADAPAHIKEYLLMIVKSGELNETQAEKLGDYLFGDSSNLFVCGLVASILRVRYETPEEYKGLLKSVSKTFQLKTLLKREKTIQIAEPFDGVDHSYMITPLLAEHFTKAGYDCIVMCGENSGPKFGNNVYDIAKELGARFIQNIDDISYDSPLGLYLDQKTLSPAMDRWVKIRRNTVKRPFLSTIERFVNPFNANIMIASAFHPPYGEKMLQLCEAQGFPAVVIVRNGMEGTIAFPLMRSAKMLCTVRRSDGAYVRNEIEFNPKTELGIAVDLEEKTEHPDPKDNAVLLQKYLKTGSSGNKLFDLRVKATVAGLDKALEWIKNPVTKSSVKLFTGHSDEQKKKVN